MKILIVEDEDPLRALYVRYLGAKGYTAIEARDGLAGLEAFRAERPDVVLSDVLLPGLTGVDLCEQIRKIDPDVPIVFMTAIYRSPSFAAQAKARLGVTRFLCKPFPLERLVGEIEGIRSEGMSQAPEPGAPEEVAEEEEQLEREATPFSAAGHAPLIDGGDEGNLYRLHPISPNGPRQHQGHYGGISLAGLLHRLYHESFTGSLLLRRGEVRKEIWMVNGHPVGAASNVRSEVLGYWLVEKGWITTEEHQQSLEIMLTEQLPQGEALLSMGVVDYGQLMQALEHQAREKIEACFAWTDGEYGTLADERTADHHALFQLNPLVGVFAGVAHHQPVGELMSHFDGLARAVPQRTPELDSYTVLFQPFEFEMAIAELCDGARPVSQVLFDSPAPMVDTLRILRALELVGGLRIEPPESVAARATDARSAQPEQQRDEVSAEVMRAWLEASKADFYTCLSLEPDATSREVEQAHHAATRRYTPALLAQLDSATRSRAKLLIHKMNRAREVLCNRWERDAYDQELFGETEVGRSDIIVAELGFRDGLACLHRHDVNAALASFERAVGADPGQIIYRMYRAYARYLEKSEDASRAAARDEIGGLLIEDVDQPVGFLLLGRISELEGNAQLAGDMYRRVIQLDEESLEGWRGLRRLRVAGPAAALKAPEPEGLAATGR